VATLTLRDLDDELEQRLRVRAAHANRSMEEEARQILRAALVEAAAPTADLAQRVRARFVGFGGVVLDIPEREPVRSPPDFASKPRAPTAKALRARVRKST
jgi:antitoxin FitA